MNYIKTLHIEGYKKFSEMDIKFNENMNIIVGENESGKSTILECIKIILNKQYKNSDKSILKEMFNTDMINVFMQNPTVKNLPFIYIELQIDIHAKCQNAEYFYGENNRIRKAAYGIIFECKFNEELGAGLEKDIINGNIPYEYYSLSWKTFAGLPYHIIKKPFNFLSIDTSNNDSNNSFNYYNRTLFNSQYDESTRMNAKNSFRSKIGSMFNEIGLESISQHAKFGINDKKVILETILSVYENSIALENRGSGMESLIKTQIALDKRKSQLDVILIEEPENHLCFSNMEKMLNKISSRQSDSQIIITTHSNMIASRLNLNNILWVSENKIISLRDVNKEVADFFVKADNNGFLQLLLSQKVILVEGATEFLLLPKIYFQITNRKIEDDGVSIISCNGISYKRYLEIVGETDKRIAVITDNDKKIKRIEKSKHFNDSNKNQHIFMGEDDKNWTWETCFYNINKEIFQKMIKTKNGYEYLYLGENYGQVLGKMLNNKVDIAYKMLISDIKFNIPKYVEDAIKWLNA